MAPLLPDDTPRLRFRWWCEEDWPLALKLWGDGRVTRLIDARPTLDEPAVRARLERELQHARERNIQYWLVSARDGGHEVGCCGLKPSELGERVLELGFHLLPDAWGHGYATEAAKSVVAHAFERLHVEALFAGHHPQNEASRRVVAKLGFRRTGESFFAPTGLMHPAYLLEASGYQRI